MTRLREVETDLRRVTRGKSIRLVEESGQQLRALLCQADPWSRTDCGRAQCSACTGEEGAQGRCRDRNLVYMNTCIECKKQEKVTRYLGETNRSLWERNAEHQADALNPSKKSHIRDHVAEYHPNMLHNMLETFKISVIKPARSALQRQVREAVEIARDRSYLLLNSKEEYNRCLVPTIRMEGPAHPRQQAEEERALDTNNTRLTRDQEEEAIGQAKALHKKRREMDKQMRKEETKRIRLDRCVDAEGREEDGQQGDEGGGDGDRGLREAADPHKIQTDIRKYTQSIQSHPPNSDDQNSDVTHTIHQEMSDEYDCDDVGSIRDEVPSATMRMIHRDEDKLRNEVPKQTQVSNGISGQISSKANNFQPIINVRPPTRTRVTKFARRRKNITHMDDKTRDIRTFFTPKSREK